MIDESSGAHGYDGTDGLSTTSSAVVMKIVNMTSGYQLSGVDSYEITSPNAAVACRRRTVVHRTQLCKAARRQGDMGDRHGTTCRFALYCQSSPFPAGTAGYLLRTSSQGAHLTSTNK